MYDNTNICIAMNYSYIFAYILFICITTFQSDYLLVSTYFY